MRFTRKWIIVLAAVFFVTALSGCDAVQRKFTRKKKAPAMPRFYQLKKYPKKPAAELYQKHYSYWRTWQAELIKTLGQNSKKDKRCAAEAVGQLKDMQNLLIPSKAKEMEPHIEKMNAAKEVVLRGDLTFSNKDDLKRTFEREDRAINRDFSYTKVRNSLRKTTDDEEAPKLTMAEGQEGKAAPVEPEK
ncbi:MAG: hypothetical protein PHX20_05540 [Candidatus Omnitrophica bacterium]|nr:hypothetical protein [Candidatus Omnitrophota bacterium]